MKAIVNGIILLPDRELTGQALIYDTKIHFITDCKAAAEMADTIIDANGCYVAPGLIDTHMHGYGGFSVTDGTPDDLRQIARGLLRYGVTAFLPTSDTQPWPVLTQTFDLIRSLMQESRHPDFPGAEILGAHAEGPFLNPARKGAMNEHHIQAFDLQKVLPCADVIRVMTIAPELPGGLDFIRSVKSRTGIHLSIGHSDADCQTACNAFLLGVSRATHLFNAMSPLNHRAPGVVGAALTSDVFVELIADNFHVDPVLFRLLAQAKGSRVCLITDTERYADMPDGEYEDDGQRYILHGHECRLDNGTIACSVLHMNEAVRNYMSGAGIPLYEAVRAASLTPAQSIGMDERKGSLTPGKDADIIIMSHDFTVMKTIVRGTVQYTHSER